MNIEQEDWNVPRRQSGLGENTDNDNADEENVNGDDMRIRRPFYHNMMMMCKTEGHRCENWDSLGLFAFLSKQFQ